MGMISYRHLWAGAMETSCFNHGTDLYTFSLVSHKCAVTNQPAGGMNAGEILASRLALQ